MRRLLARLKWLAALVRYYLAAGSQASKLGCWGESAAARQLRRSGHQILARRTRLGGVEVDLLTRYRSTLVLVEVKTRISSRPVGDINIVGERQLARLRYAAKVLARRCPAQIASVQVDLVFVTFRRSGKDPEILHRPKLFSFSARRGVRHFRWIGRGE